MKLILFLLSLGIFSQVKTTPQETKSVPVEPKTTKEAKISTEETTPIETKTSSTEPKQSVENQPSSSPKTSSTFMGSSLIHMPSTEAIGKKNLDFRFNHRFNNAKNTLDDFFGFDGGANTQLSLDYGLSDKWSVGLARTSFFKTYELRTKYSLLSEKEGSPVSISLFAVVGQETSKQIIKYEPYINPPTTGIATIDSGIKQYANQYELTADDKRSFLGSILISKKIGIFSIQASPMFVHRNFIKNGLGNDRVGLDIGGRIKLTKRIDLTFEAIFLPKRDYVGDNYSYLDREGKFNTKTLTAEEINSQYNRQSDLAFIYTRNVLLDKKVQHYYTPFSIGLDIETGGHVFQLFVTNSRAIAHTQLLRGAEFDYGKKDWTVGFNIHRHFSFQDDEDLK